MPSRPWSEQPIERRILRMRALSLIGQGFSQRAVGRLLGVPNPTVHNWTKPPKPYKAQVAAIKRSSKTGYCDLCNIRLGRDGQTMNEHSDELMPGLGHSDPATDTRCRECRALYGDGPAAAILGRWGIASAEETPWPGDEADVRHWTAEGFGSNGGTP
jgi:hypothetical protein